MEPTLTIAASTAGGILLGAGVLHSIPRLGAVGKALSAALCRAPGLDLVVTYFTVAPLFVGPLLAGWRGLAGAVAGQVAGLVLWCWIHELAHLDAWRGPRIVTTMNRIVGRWRNHAAVWLTAIVTPVFWLVRLAQVAIYPLISALIGLPPYKQGEWVNVSRQKFANLVGHDRAWCLYCDWMTGVWSLGSEMLRNVESFWCPIKFASGKKCDNCKLDFPDIAGGWVPADGTMAQVASLLEAKYAGGERGWFGHPARLTIGGKPVAPAVSGGAVVEVKAERHSRVE